MVLIIGGAYQGKLDFAREKFKLQDRDIYTCSGEKPDFSCPCIYGLEKFVLYCVQKNIDPRAYFEERRKLWEQSIIICEDIFCGVVPLGAETREWRQETGKLCQYLSAEATQVSRIFCGLEQRLK